MQINHRTNCCPAEYSFETDVFFMILRCKIMKNTSVSNLNLARSTEKDLLHNLSLGNILSKAEFYLCGGYSAA